MTYPRQFFLTAGQFEQSGTCFVLMPFDQNFTSVYNTISEALEAPDVGFRCRRADDFYGGHQIMEDVLREIGRSEIIVVDVTTRNPNVFYELGIAHMAKSAERVLLITQRVEDIPFDLRAYRHIVYSADETGLRQLRRRLSTAVIEVAGMCYRFTVNFEGSHDTPPSFAGPDRCLYSMHISDAMMGQGFVKCKICVKKHVIGEPPRVVQKSSFGFSERETRQPHAELPWALRLDSARNDIAAFSIVKVSPTVGE